MSDSLAQQVVNLLRRFGKQFNRKFSEVVMILVNHKNARSFGALAGFAIAVAFTWKFFRAPSRSRRSQQKQIGSASTSDDGTQTHTTSDAEVDPSIANLKDVDVVGEFHPPAKLTLGQVVRKKLNGSRKMTCQLLGVIFEENSPEELQMHATVKPSVVEVLLEISKLCDIYLMERILDDESGDRALSALESAGLFKTGGLIRDKVLFCSTETGRASFVRQLEPDWHVDTNLDIIAPLARFIRYQLHISPAGSSSRVASNVFSSASLEDHFSC